ncbi:MAG: HAD-IA family hydrolase [Firmicutes bacterium]|nr:HAD-IA family hydrolase [Bacillota bacterium]
MRYQAVLFDLDGTLIDTIPLIRFSFEQVFAKLSLPWGNGEVLKTIGLPLREAAERFAPTRVEEFLSLYSMHQQSRHQELTKLFPGAWETLTRLRDRGCLTAVVTSKRRSTALTGLALTGIDGLIQVTVSIDDVTRPKPDAEPVLRALEVLGVKPEDSVYVGDSWYDIISGREAGVTTVGVTWGMASREELDEAGPDFIVSTWDELLAVFSLPPRY